MFPCLKESPGSQYLFGANSKLFSLTVFQEGLQTDKSVIASSYLFVN